MNQYAWIEVAAITFCLVAGVFALPPASDTDWLVILVVYVGFLMWGLQGIRARKFPVSYVRRGFSIYSGIYTTGAVIWSVMTATLCGITILGEISIPMAAACITSARCMWLYWEAARAVPRTPRW